MSYVQAFQAHTKGTDDSLRQHPVADFLFHHQESFDNGNLKSEPYTVFHTDDFTFTNSDGTVLPAGEASWQAFIAGYAAFTAHLHEARSVCVYERGGGWEMVGTTVLHADLPVPGGEKTKKDVSGRAWDLAMPGAMVFNVVKDPAGLNGFKIKAMTVFADKSPAVVEMIKRGMMKPGDLLKMP